MCTYLVFKKCPVLAERSLVDLFNRCWQTKTVPLAWKIAGIKLLGKGSAFQISDLSPCDA